MYLSSIQTGYRPNVINRTNGINKSRFGSEGQQLPKRWQDEFKELVQVGKQAGTVRNYRAVVSPHGNGWIIEQGSLLELVR